MSEHPLCVLVSDQLSSKAIGVFENKGIAVDYYPDLGKDPAQLLDIIGQYDGLAVRSATKVTGKLIEAAKKLKVVGRAGIGVDNIDVEAASRSGILVMNTPFANSVTTAEHAIALMFGLARQLPEANLSTHQGKWEKNHFMGTEITGKTLAILGCGNVGALVAMRGIGLGMCVIVHDPFLSEARARELGVKKVELQALFAQADFLTIHVPLTERTHNIIDKVAIAQMKDGVYIINCARGGLLVEKDLAAALRCAKVAGAALDVFEVEPAKNNELFGLSNVICTPHLGASTHEAQENVALQIATQISDYLLEGAVVSAVNMPLVSREEASRLRGYARLTEVLGSFLAQITEEPVLEVEVLFDGSASERNTSFLVASVLQGLLKSWAPHINIVSAPFVAKDMGILLSEVKRHKSGIFDGYIRVTVKTHSGSSSISGTCHSDERPRFIGMGDLCLEALASQYMLYAINRDTPGIIGLMGSVCGLHRVNIADFHLGRSHPGGDAVALLSLDAPLPLEALEELANHPDIIFVRRLCFEIKEA